MAIFQPFASVRVPSTPLVEKVSPGLSTVPLMRSAPLRMLYLRLLVLPLKLVSAEVEMSSNASPVRVGGVAVTGSSLGVV